MKNDVINHPNHYTQDKYECIEFTENMNLNLGSAFGYVWRFRRKNGLEDLNKASWFVERELNVPNSAGSFSTEVSEELQSMVDELQTFNSIEQSIFKKLICAGECKPCKPDMLKEVLRLIHELKMTM